MKIILSFKLHINFIKRVSTKSTIAFHHQKCKAIESKIKVHKILLMYPTLNRVRKLTNLNREFKIQVKYHFLVNPTYRKLTLQLNNNLEVSRSQSIRLVKKIKFQTLRMRKYIHYNFIESQLTQNLLK